jgi:hypothetical protein
MGHSWSGGGKQIRDPCPPGWGTLTLERVKYGDESVPRDSDPKNTQLARASSNCKLHTSPLVREGAAHQQTRNSLSIILKIRKLTAGVEWVPDTKTD